MSKFYTLLLLSTMTSSVVCNSNSILADIELGGVPLDVNITIVGDIDMQIEQLMVKHGDNETVLLDILFDQLRSLESIPVSRISENRLILSSSLKRVPELSGKLASNLDDSYVFAKFKDDRFSMDVLCPEGAFKLELKNPNITGNRAHLLGMTYELSRIDFQDGKCGESKIPPVAQPANKVSGSNLLQDNDGAIDSTQKVCAVVDSGFAALHGADGEEVATILERSNVILPVDIELAFILYLSDSELGYSPVNNEIGPAEGLDGVTAYVRLNPDDFEDCKFIVHLTGYQLEGSTLGIAWVNTDTCSTSLEFRTSTTTAAARYSLLQIAVTVAHEMGHTLGLSHNGVDNNQCNPSDGYLMDEYIQNPLPTQLSACSLSVLDNIDCIDVAPAPAPSSSPAPNASVLNTLGLCAFVVMAGDM
eukprot:273301_1